MNPKTENLKNQIQERDQKVQEVAKKQENALESLARNLNVDKKVLQNTLMRTAFKECKTTEDFVTAVIVANKYGLNPLLREMYVFPARGGGITPIVSIDGWISLVNRHASFDGVSLVENERDGKLDSITATFYLKDKSQPIVVTEYMAECYDEKKEPWRKWPRRMLRHKAYIQGARVAFGFSGIYDPDEGQRIAEGEEIELTPEQTTVSNDMAGEMPETRTETATEYPEKQPETDRSDTKPAGTITEPQRKKIFACGRDLGMDKTDLDQFVNHFKGKSVSQLSKAEASEVIEYLIKKGPGEQPDMEEREPGSDDE